MTLTGLAARVLWFDRQVERALDAGIDQVAVVGAGYDSRAWRCARPGVRFVELDHGGTQHDKVRRAPAGPGPTFVEADLRVARAHDALAGGGIDPGRPALHVVEGLTMYLVEADVRRLLEDLRRASAPGSRLLVDFYPPDRAGTKADSRRIALQRMAHTGSGERFRLGLGPAEAGALVGSSGWSVDELTDLRAAGQALVPPSSGLPIDRVNRHKALVSAVRR